MKVRGIAAVAAAIWLAPAAASERWVDMDPNILAVTALSLSGTRHAFYTARFSVKNTGEKVVSYAGIECEFYYPEGDSFEVKSTSLDNVLPGQLAFGHVRIFSPSFLGRVLCRPHLAVGEAVSR